MPKPEKSVSRRQFVKGLSLAGMTATLGSHSVAGGAHSHVSTEGKKAKNLIFLVVDGLGIGTYSMAQRWSLHKLGKPLNWTNLYSNPKVRRSLQDTASLSSPVTDSAAAASAWGCGQRVANRAINTAGDGSVLKPLYQYAKEAGKATGLVSTCRITHATPAGFAVSVAHRDMEDEIALQYLECEIDVLLGGGRQHFQRSAVAESPEWPPIDLIPEFEKKGYTLAKNKSDLMRMASSFRLLGLFSESHMPYVIDRRHDARFSEMPDLPTLFKTALQSLGSSKKGFFLQVEAGRIDHAGHVNDHSTILQEFLEFDRCIPIALDYLKKDPDTLLIITTDHGTGGCQLNGVGDAYIESGPALDRIDQASASFEALESEFRASGRFDPERFSKATGLVPTEAQSRAIQRALEDGAVEYLSSAMTKIMSDTIMERTAVGWTSNEHTTEHVDLFAMGPGSEQLSPFIKNNELFGLIVPS